jgi:alpha-tubulin suppressor-like RCC1 family protein
VVSRAQRAFAASALALLAGCGLIAGLPDADATRVDDPDSSIANEAGGDREAPGTTDGPTESGHGDGGRDADAGDHPDTGDGGDAGDAADVWSPTVGPAELTAHEGITCLLRHNDGTVVCWGAGVNGRLGRILPDGGTSTPVPGAVVDGNLSPATFLRVAIGAVHACGVTTSHQLQCWGVQAFDTLGARIDDGTYAAAQTALLKASPRTPYTGVNAVAVGKYRTCILLASDGGTASDTLYCWGSDNSTCDIGLHGTDDPAQLLVPVASGLSYTQVVMGIHHGCVLANNGDVYCWGSNIIGEIAQKIGQDGGCPGDHRGFGVPTKVALPPVAALTTLRSTTCAITRAQEVYCWGDNTRGQLGYSNAIDRDAGRVSTEMSDNNEERLYSATPSHVPGVDGAEQVTCGEWFCCARVAGNVKCWGTNGEWELARDIDNDYVEHPSPANVVLGNGQPLTGVVDVAAGQYHACALTSDKVYCWGWNGNTEQGTSDPPARVARPAPFGP